MVIDRVVGGSQNPGGIPDELFDPYFPEFPGEPTGIYPGGPVGTFLPTEPEVKQPSIDPELARLLREALSQNRSV